MVTDPVDEFLDPFRCSKVAVVLGIPNFIWLSHSQKMLGVKDGQGILAIWALGQTARQKWPKK